MPLERHECYHCDRSVLVDARSVDSVVCDCCQDSYYTCDTCDEYIHSDDSEHSGDGVYCEACFNDRFVRCYECSEAVSIDDRSRYGGNDYCGSCCPSDEDDDDEDGPIRSYGYDRPKHLFIKIGNGPHYGLELEVQVRDGYSTGDVADRILADLDPEDQLLWVAKHDGSLIHGFELESLPMSKEAIQQSLTMIEGHKDRLKGFHGNNCGLHVNCDRPASRLHQYKIARFMHDRANKRLLECIGQRGLNGYCYQEDISVYPFRRYHRPENSKHGAVAFVGNRVEFRIFKANLLPQRINKAIDFCQAVIDFCRDTSVKNLNVPKFLSYVWSHKWRYIDLVDFLLEKSTGLFIGKPGFYSYKAARARKMAQLDNRVLLARGNTQVYSLPELVEA
jgi:hypothetical protein